MIPDKDAFTGSQLGSHPGKRLPTQANGSGQAVVRQSAALEMEQSSLADENTIRVPSGGHAGHPSPPGAVVKRPMWLPSASITKML